MKTCIIMIGYPGSGKSTLSKAIRDNYNIGYISSGDIARNMAKDNNNINDDLINGKLASENEMRSRILSAINEMNKDIFILDGFPRFVEQDRWLHSLSGYIRFKYILVETNDINININRLNVRGRLDDNQESIKNRFDYYRNNTAKILDLHRYTLFVNNDSNKQIFKDHVHGLVKKLREEGINIVNNK